MMGDRKVEQVPHPSQQAIIPDAPKPNPGNVVPSPSSQEGAGGSHNLAKLQSMSLKQLQDLAAEEEVTVPHGADKSQVIRLIRGGR